MPETNHTCQKLREIVARRNQAAQKVVEFARTLVMTLQDRSCASAALELESRLAMVDMADEEFGDFVTTDPEGAIAAILDGIRRG